MNGWSPELSRTLQNNNRDPECTESTQCLGTSTDRCCLSFSGKVQGLCLSCAQYHLVQRNTGSRCVPCRTAPESQHRATLLLMLYNNQKQKPSTCFWESPSKISQKAEAGQGAFKLGNCPLHSLPPLPALLHYRSSSSNVSMHCNINNSSSMGRSGSCNTQDGRGWVFI